MNAERVRIYAEPGGEIALASEAAGQTTSGPVTERTVFFAEALSGDDRDVRSVTVEVRDPTPVDPPTVDTFSVTPDPVDLGASFTATWSVTGADPSGYLSTASRSRAAWRARGASWPRRPGPTGSSSSSKLRTPRVRTSRTQPVNVTPPMGLEVEPNDDPSSATRTDAMGLATARLDLNDVDFFEVTVPEGGWVRAETSDGQGGCTVDQAAALTDASGAQLASGRPGPPSSTATARSSGPAPSSILGPRRGRAS